MKRVRKFIKKHIIQNDSDENYEENIEKLGQLPSIFPKLKYY